MYFHSFPKLKFIFLALIILSAGIAFGVGGRSIFAHAQSQPCSVSSSNAIVANAIAICNGQGQAINNWSGNLAVPYVYGGGHNPKSPGPNTGNKLICPNGQSSSCGVDCSGFARWVYYLAYNNVDVLGAGNTQSQMSLLTKIPNASAQPGDLVYFVKKTPKGVEYHVGVFIGTNQMIDSPNANGHPPHFVRLDKVLNKSGQGTFGTVIGYFRYPSSTKSGTLDWKYQTGGIVGGAPAVVNGVAYAGSEDYHLYALNSSTGAVIWKYPTGFYVSSTPAVVNGVVYFGSDDTYVYALNCVL